MPADLFTWALKPLDPYKLSDLDGVNPVLSQRAGEAGKELGIFVSVYQWAIYLSAEETAC